MRVLQVKPEVSEIAAWTGLHRDIIAFAQVLQQFGRKIVLHKVYFTAQQFQDAHTRVFPARAYPPPVKMVAFAAL